MKETWPSRLRCSKRTTDFAVVVIPVADRHHNYAVWVVARFMSESVNGRDDRRHARRIGATDLGEDLLRPRGRNSR